MERHASGLTLVLLLSVATSAVPAHARNAAACNSFLCMAGVTGVGAPGGPACAGPIAAFHALQVWNPYFNAAATASLRRRYLMTCPGLRTPGNLAILNAIIARWGYRP